MDIFADVLAANLLTAMLIYGVVTASRDERTSGHPSWRALAMIGFPLAVLLLAFFATEPLPPSLDALAAQ